MGTDEASPVLERTPFCVLELPRIPELDNHHHSHLPHHHDQRRPHLPLPASNQTSSFSPQTGLPSPPQQSRVATSPPRTSTTSPVGTKRAWAVVNPPEHTGDHFHHHHHPAGHGPSSTQQQVSEAPSTHLHQPPASTQLPPISPFAGERPSPERIGSPKRQRLSPPPDPSLLRNPSLVSSNPPPSTRAESSPAYANQPSINYSASQPVPSLSTGAVFQSGQSAQQASAQPTKQPPKPRARVPAPSQPKDSKARFPSPPRVSSMVSPPRSPTHSSPVGPGEEHGRSVRTDPVRAEIEKSRQQAPSPKPDATTRRSPKSMGPPPSPRPPSAPQSSRGPCDECSNDSILRLKEQLKKDLQNGLRRDSGESSNPFAEMEFLSESIRLANEQAEARWRKCSCNRHLQESSEESFDLIDDGHASMRPASKRSHSPSVAHAVGEPSHKSLRFSPEASNEYSNGQHATQSSGMAQSGRMHGQAPSY